MTDRFMYGWRVRSEIALPELTPWLGDDRLADVVIRVGAVPKQLDDAVYRDRVLEIGRDGAALLTAAGIAIIWVRAPDEIIVSPHPEASADEIRLVLFGSAVGCLCHLRGFFPLHGACIGIGERAVVFAGPSGAGKSTIAAYLCERGHRLVADDVSAIEILNGVASVWPAFPRLKLDPDAYRTLALDHSEPAQPALIRGKYHLDRRRSFRSEPVPLAAIVLLEQPGADGAASLARLHGNLASMTRLYADVFRPVVASALGGPRRLFAIQAEIVRTVPIYLWRRRFDFEAMNAWIDQLERLADE